MLLAEDTPLKSLPNSGIPLLKLPDEVLQLISSRLSNKDIKNLRLASKRLRATSILRIERVFISPSYKNIEVLHAVAGSAEFCARVKEIVWDDARFRKYLAIDEEGEGEDWDDDRSGIGPNIIEDFESACEENLEWVGGSESDLVRARSAAIPFLEGDLMTLNENFALYRQFYEEQQEIIQAGLDVEAFRESLSAFSSLERVTVTSEAHRIAIHAPRYPTPMIRSFPPSFNYPIPWPWCGERERYNFVQPWDEAREHWRGFTVVLEELANCPRTIPEFIVDVNGEATGIAYQFFETESKDFSNFEIICGRGLKRLDLAVNVAQYQRSPGLRSLPHSLLKRALSAATSLQHFSIHSSTTTRDVYSNENLNDCTDVLEVISVHEWTSLDHLTVSHLPLRAPELLGLIKKLPTKIKSLKFVDLLLYDGTWAEVLRQLKDELHWAGNHPKITIANSQEIPYQRVWLQEEIARYLDGGDNPFVGKFTGSEIQWGFGTIRDDFDESIEAPFEPDRRMHVQISPGVWEERKPDVLLDDRSL